MFLGGPGMIIGGGHIGFGGTGIMGGNGGIGIGRGPGSGPGPGYGDGSGNGDGPGGIIGGATLHWLHDAHLEYREPSYAEKQPQMLQPPQMVFL